jgi:DNA gyrase subunit A
MVVVKRDATLLVVTERGLGKCSNIADYRVQKRGGKGIITVNRTEKTGDVVALMEVLPADEIMIITKHGVIIRSSVSQVRVTGRIAQGVKLVNLDEGDVVTAVARVVPEDEGDDTENGAPASEAEQVEALTDESRNVLTWSLSSRKSRNCARRCVMQKPKCSVCSRKLPRAGR